MIAWRETVLCSYGRSGRRRWCGPSDLLAAEQDSTIPKDAGSFLRVPRSRSVAHSPLLFTRVRQRHQTVHLAEDSVVLETRASPTRDLPQAA